VLLVSKVFEPRLFTHIEILTCLPLSHGVSAVQMKNCTGQVCSISYLSHGHWFIAKVRHSMLVHAQHGCACASLWQLTTYLAAVGVWPCRLQMET
jgi:hypothetical protein